MKFIVIQGEDTQKLYKRLTTFLAEAKKRTWDVFTDTLPDTPSLFGTKRLVIYRDYRLLGKRDLKSAEKVDGSLVIYNEGNLPQTFIKTLPKDTKIEKYDLPKSIFSFLDSFYPGNAKNTIKLLHETINSEAVELIFYLLVKHLRDLYWARLDPKSMTLPSWRLSKLRGQAGRMTEENLKKYIEDLAQIDMNVKTSKTDLLSSLDFFIIKNLK